MASPARFTFDLDLRAPTRAAPAPGMPEDLVAQLVAEARREGIEEGRRAGEAAAATATAQTLAAAAAALAAETVRMATALDEAGATARREAVELAATIGRKLAGHLVARYPLAEIEALVAECLASLDHAPHLVVRCNPDLAEAVRDAATAHMDQTGFSGRLVVLGEPELRLGDCRLEWVDGGLIRDIGAIARDIDTKISAYLAARGTGDQQEIAP